MNRKTLLSIANTPVESLPGLLESLLPGMKPGWAKAARKFLAFLSDGVPRFSVFVKGNGKLPFWAFSCLPIVTCPGAGDCLNWCYSLRAFRYPDAFFRQLQNTVLLRLHPEAVAAAFRRIPDGCVVRLYVDGDIETVPILSFWQELCRERGDLSVYGYSKSWELFLAYRGEWAENYTLNLSGGSRYGEEMKAKMRTLPVVRGEFLAFPSTVKAPKRDGKTGKVVKGDWLAYKRSVEASAKLRGFDKVFVCPGLCGFCSNGKHACGNRRFDGVAIAIGIH